MESQDYRPKMPLEAFTREKLAAVRAKYAHVLPHIELASGNTEGTLGEKQLWHLIARHVSKDWAKAYARLQNAWQDRQWLYAPDNRPLGAIGQALAAEEIYLTQRELDEAQAIFTVLDETLRQDDELALLLQDQLMRQRSLDAAAGLSHGILGLTFDMDFVEKKPAPPLTRVFGNLALRLGDAMRIAAPVRKPEM